MVAMKSVFLWVVYLVVICRALPSSSKPDVTSQSLIQADSLEKTAAHKSSSTRSSNEGVTKGAPITLSPRITSFYQSYYEEKEKLTDVPLWNLLPVGYRARNDTFANSVKAFTPKDTALSDAGQTLFSFNISSIAKMEYVEVIGAEFRIKSRLSSSPSDARAQDRDDQLKLNLYEILGDAQTPRLVLRTSQQLTAVQGADNVFTVTPIVRDWLSGKSTGHGFSVELVSETGEDLSIFLEDTPILVLYMNKEREWKDRDSLLKYEEKKRTRRSTVSSEGEATATKPIPPCAMKSVNFHISDLGMEGEVLAPTRIIVNYCSGHCLWPYTLTPASNSAHLQGRVAFLIKKEPPIPMPCCAPKEFGNNLYFVKTEDGGFTSKLQRNEKVLSCECR